MPIIKNGRIQEDIWVSLTDREAETLDRNTPVLVSLEEWKAGRETLVANFDRRAVRLENADDVEDIREDLADLDAVILVFPKFNDGRAFSQARLLRDRFGFKGEIRATGHVIQDQFLFLQRCGVDAVEVADENAAIGKILGPSFPAEGVVDAIDTLIGTFRNIRTEGETFIDTVSRVGITPFKETLYANH